MENFLDHTDLRALHVIFCITGVLLSTHLMQLVWHNEEEGGLLLRWVRRINLALVALAMLWSLSIVNERGWSPWPPGVLLTFSVDLMMLIRVIVIYRMRERGAHVVPTYLQGVVERRRVG